MIEYADFEMPIVATSAITDLKREEVIGSLRENNFACIRGLFDTQSLSRSLVKLNSGLISSSVAPSTGEAPTAVRQNFAKMNIGGASLRYNNYARFFRTFYNPTWDEDIYGMRENFRTLIKLRNFIYGLDVNFALDEVTSDRLFSACRLQQYPAGGGFFSTHRDTTLLDVAKDNDLNFYQLILVITEYGKDFTSGGAYIDKDESRYLLEKQCKTGDVLVYDGRSYHGVEEVDPHLPLDLNKIDGRVVALASLYSA